MHQQHLGGGKGDLIVLDFRGRGNGHPIERARLGEVDELRLPRCHRGGVPRLLRQFEDRRERGIDRMSQGQILVPLQRVLYRRNACEHAGVRWEGNGFGRRLRPEGETAGINEIMNIGGIGAHRGVRPEAIDADDYDFADLGDWTSRLALNADRARQQRKNKHAQLFHGSVINDAIFGFCLQWRGGALQRCWGAVPGVQLSVRFTLE